MYPLSIIGLQDIFTLAICYASLGSFLHHHFATHEHHPPHQTMDQERQQYDPIDFAGSSSASDFVANRNSQARVATWKTLVTAQLLVPTKQSQSWSTPLRTCPFFWRAGSEEKGLRVHSDHCLYPGMPRILRAKKYSFSNLCTWLDIATCRFSSYRDMGSRLICIEAGRDIRATKSWSIEHIDTRKAGDVSEVQKSGEISHQQFGLLERPVSSVGKGNPEKSKMNVYQTYFHTCSRFLSCRAGWSDISQTCDILWGRMKWSLESMKMHPYPEQQRWHNNISKF